MKRAGEGPLTSYEYQEALAKCRRLTRTEGIDAVLDKHKLDALVAPSRRAGLGDGPGLRRPLAGSCTYAVAAVAGYPSITVPAGFLFGLPVGPVVHRPGLE